MNKLQDKLMQAYLYKMLLDFETKWRDNPTPIALPQYIASNVKVRPCAT